MSKVATLYLEGHSLREVGRELGISHESVRTRLRREGVELRRRGHNGQTEAPKRKRETLPWWHSPPESDTLPWREARRRRLSREDAEAFGRMQRRVMEGESLTDAIRAEISDPAALRAFLLGEE